MIRGVCQVSSRPPERVRGSDRCVNGPGVSLLLLYSKVVLARDTNSTELTRNIVARDDAREALPTHRHEISLTRQLSHEDTQTILKIQDYKYIRYIK
jgi:hypothetical protein